MRPARIVMSPSAVHDRASEGHLKAQQSVQRLDEEAFAKVVAFIDANLSQRISIDDLSSLVDISRHHFSRRFKMKVGMSPYAFITACRMQLAKRLLMETSLSHEAVAEQVGFSHMGHFRSQFRKHLGISLSDLRETAAADCKMARARS